MCGIVGVFHRQGTVVDELIQGLSVLEYRGYDSAGIGLAQPQGVAVRRRTGHLAALREALSHEPLHGLPVGVGRNAHPHTDRWGRIALVHNGIVENHDELRAELAAAGVEFRSDTDTEVLTHLIGEALNQGGDAVDALGRALERVRGYYALALVLHEEQGAARLLCARQGPPLAVGLGPRGACLASDPLALRPDTQRVQYLEDGDLAELGPDGLRIRARDGASVERPMQDYEHDAAAADRGGYAHHMLKEIHEQPGVLAHTLEDRLDLQRGDVDLGGGVFADEELRAIERISILGCGTALYAGQLGRAMIEGLARVPVDTDFASEFRYRSPIVAPHTLALAISQSGETADTLAAMRLAVDQGATPAAICNVGGSTLARESQGVVLTHAGPEIGVASTKAFVAQVATSLLLAVRLGRARGTLDATQGRALLEELRGLRPRMERLLEERAHECVRGIAARFADARGYLFLGRGLDFPLACEGALKLKEISYRHAEGYAAGEMKHGPIALVEPSLCTVALHTAGPLAEKTRANIEQVQARGGPVFGIGSDEGCLAVADEAFRIEPTGPWTAPLLNVLPLQLFAYHVADLLGCEIDKPRNLAKSVTVE